MPVSATSGTDSCGLASSVGGELSLRSLSTAIPISGVVLDISPAAMLANAIAWQTTEPVPGDQLANAWPSEASAIE